MTHSEAAISNAIYASMAVALVAFWAWAVWVIV